MSRLKFTNKRSHNVLGKPSVKPMSVYGSSIQQPKKHPRTTHHCSESMSRRDFTRGTVAALAGLAIALTGGGLWYTNRSIFCEINGVEQEIAWHSSINDILNEGVFTPRYGNLVSVTNRLLKEGEGNRYTVSVNGKDLGDGIDDYRASSGDVIVFTNGTDKTEDAETTTKPLPYEIEKDAGAGSIGFVSQWGKAGQIEELTGKLSGEKTERTSDDDGQNMVVSYLNVQPAQDQKLVAITFDDGPSEYSLKIAEILKEHNAQATFFDIGNNVQAHPDIVKRVKELGHQVACHSMTHPPFTSSSADVIHQEITNSTAKLHDLGVDTKIFRAPYGAFSLREWGILQDGITALIGWTIDTLDWKKPGVETIVKNATQTMKPGSIILCHAGGGKRDQTVEALPKILEAWQHEGYTFVTINDLLKSDSRFPAEVLADNVHRPDDQKDTPSNINLEPTTSGDEVKGTAGMG